jgi:mRNA interferase HigB
MRIIARRTLKEFWTKHPAAEFPLTDWYEKTEDAIWLKPSDIKNTFRSADIINDKRVAFDIGGNKYRVVGSVNYYLKQVFVIWIGTHSEYDKIVVEKVEFKRRYHDTK